MALWLLNAFSLNMVTNLPATITVEEVGLGVAKALVRRGFQSAVGHADTAALFSNVLDVEVPFNRTTVSLPRGSKALVGQYVGPRLPEGTTTLPPGATIKWLFVTVH